MIDFPDSKILSLAMKWRSDLQLWLLERICGLILSNSGAVSLIHMKRLCCIFSFINWSGKITPSNFSQPVTLLCVFTLLHTGGLWVQFHYETGSLQGLMRSQEVFSVLFTRNLCFYKTASYKHLKLKFCTNKTEFIIVISS